MFDIAIALFALASFVAICLVGGRFVATDDARERVALEDNGPIGWLPSARDKALLTNAARDLHVLR